MFCSRKESENVEQKKEAERPDGLSTVWNGRMCLRWYTCTLHTSSLPRPSNQQEAAVRRCTCEWPDPLLPAQHHVCMALLNTWLFVTQECTQEVGVCVGFWEQDQTELLGYVLGLLYFAISWTSRIPFFLKAVSNLYEHLQSFWGCLFWEVFFTNELAYTFSSNIFLSCNLHPADQRRDE